MIKNERCYKIAGYTIVVKGALESMRELDGFEYFAIDSTHVDFRIQLNEGCMEELLDGDEYYTLETSLMNCHFTRHDTGYGMRLQPRHGEASLTLRYISADSMIEIAGNTKPWLLKFALWVAFGLAVLSRQTVAVHASAIIHNHKAILFLGESGTGKSTHTRLWREHIQEVSLLNDDSPILRIESGKCYVYGSPWSGKTPCYRQVKVELAAIVRLSQAPENSMHHLNLHEAIGALYPSFPPAFSSNELLAEALYGILSDVLKQTPVYHLSCLPNEQAVQLVYNTLYSCV